MSVDNVMYCPDGLTPEDQDVFWMDHAIKLASHSEALGEVPVGCVIVGGNQLISEGWNLSIATHDATAHAEMMAIRAAGKQVSNYRLIDLTLYVTLEPCPMCASALVHARLKRVVYGAADYKTGAIDSIFKLVTSSQLNHQLIVSSGIKKECCSNLISAFFKKRRQEKKQLKKASKLI